MSYIIYCDVCKTQMKQVDRLRRILGDVMIEVLVRFKGAWNAGHVCESCLFKVINNGRPAKENESWLGDTIREKAEP